MNGIGWPRGVVDDDAPGTDSSAQCGTSAANRGTRAAAWCPSTQRSRRMKHGNLSVLVLMAFIIGAVSTVAAVRRSGAVELFRENRQCCQLSFLRNLLVTVDEVSGRRTYFSEIGQDKWVLEKVFPDVTNGYFVDIGSGHGTIGSNSR